MAEGKTAALSGRIELEGAEGRGERPAVSVYAMSAEGKVVGTAKVAADGRFTLSAAALDKASHVAIGDASADPSAGSDQFLGYRLEEARELFKGDVLRLPEGAWGPWYGYPVCVSGTVNRCFPWWDLIDHVRASSSINALATLSARTSAAKLVDISRIDPASVFHPYRCATVCQGLVEVYRRTCCCEPPIVIDPGDYYDGPVDWPPHWPPPGDPPFPEPFPPEPDPGPFPPGPGPDPAPFAMVERVASGGALDVRKLNLERDTFALRTLKGAHLSEYIKLRPYLWCTCGTGTKVGEGLIADNGTFTACWREFPHILLPNCSEEYAYKVKQVINGVTVTIYDGPAAGQWFSASAHPTLTSYSLAAVSCGGDPEVPGAGIATVLLHSIGSTESWHLGTPNQDSPDSVQNLGPTSGLIDPSAVDGPSVNRPLGGALGLRYFFSPGMESLARFFRVDVASANSAGDPVGGWTPVAVPSWNSWKWDGTSWIRAQHSLGPNASGLFEIPYETGGLLSANEQWDDHQFHAILDTTQHPDGKYLVRIEVFDNGGNQIRPTGSTGTGTQKAFTFGRWRIPAGPPDNVPYSALTHALWWDNRPASAIIEGIQLFGASGSPVCQFLSGASGDAVSIVYRAYHPHPTSGGEPSFLSGYSMAITKGIGGGTPYSTAGFPEQGKPPGVPAVNSATTLGGLLGADKKCAFAVTLYASVKTTNGGGGTLTYLDRSYVAAFAAEQP